MDELIGEFVAETLESLEHVGSEVVAWEADPTDRVRLDAFFRFFHTVKGSAGFLNLPRFERLSHGAEDVLSDLRDGKRTADSTLISGVLAIMDRIADMARALSDETPLPDEASDARLLAQLAEGAGKPDIVPEPATDTPAPPTFDQAPRPPAPAPEPVAVAAPAPSRPAAARDQAPRTIRISLALIDQLMNGVSDMVLARNELARKLRDHGMDSDLDTSFDRLSACIADMRDTVSKTRMQRMDRLFSAIPRMVRDLSLELGKQVQLQVDGGDVEMDREMIEMVLDPLTHLVRNAVDHGIETPEDRVAAGKNPTGHLRISAQQSGNQIVLQLIDDGRGINGEALVNKALKMGVMTVAETASLSDQERIQLIFHPGLSTARQVSAISGRGVGMDVVRTNVERIGGVVEVESQLGLGTKIELRVPMTLTIIPGLIVRAGGELFAMPQGSVIELIRENNPTVQVEAICGARIATIRGTRYPMVDLEAVLEQPRVDDGNGTDRTLMLIKAGGDQIYALGVDSVENSEELVIRPAPPPVVAAGVFAGITLPDNARPMLLLDVAGLAAAANLDFDAPHAQGFASTRSTDEAAEAETPTVQGLHFIDLKGRHRLIALDIVERLEDLPAARFKQVEGRPFVSLNGALVPVVGFSETLDDVVKTLILSAGSRLCYPAHDVIDIIDVPVRPDLAIESGGIAGVVEHEGQSIEVIDTHALFAQVADRSISSSKGICLVDKLGDDPWMQQILAPLLVRAGYDVRDAEDTSHPDVVSAPHVVIKRAGAGGSSSATDQATILLSEDPGAGSTTSPDKPVYLYDRPNLLARINDILGRNAA